MKFVAAIFKERDYWRRGSKDWDPYLQCTRMMKNERGDADSSQEEDVRACVELILKYAGCWGYVNAQRMYETNLLWVIKNG